MKKTSEPSAVSKPDRIAELKKQISEAAVTRNQFISAKHAAAEKLKAARAARDEDLTAETIEAFDTAEHDLKIATLNLAPHTAACDALTQELHQLEQPDLAHRLVKAIDRALTPDAPPAGKSFPHIRRKMERYQPEGSIGWMTPQARFGVPDVMLITIRGEVKSAVPDYAARTKKIQSLHARTQEVYADLQKVYISPGKQRQTHISDLSKEIQKAARPVAEMDGFSTEELEADMHAKGDAFKKILHDLSLEIYREVQPVLATAVTIISALIESELNLEGERCQKYGIPYEDPSEILLSLRQARSLMLARQKEEPYAYTSTSSITANLIPLS